MVAVLSCFFVLVTCFLVEFHFFVRSRVSISAAELFSLFCFFVILLYSICIYILVVFPNSDYSTIFSLFSVSVGDLAAALAGVKTDW